MKSLLVFLFLLSTVVQAAPASGFFLELIGRVNSLRARSSSTYIPGYPMAEGSGYYHYTLEELGQSKESLQKLLRAGHQYKDRYSRYKSAIPGYPAGEMQKVKMTVGDLLGEYYYPDEKLADLAKALGYKGKLLEADNMITVGALNYLEEFVLNVTSFRKVLRVMEPETSLDIFK